MSEVETNIRFTQDYITPEQEAETQELEALTNQANEEIEREYAIKQVYNLSVKTILQNIQITFSNILYDILTYQYYSIPTFIDIFTRKQRLLYIGIFLVLAAIATAILSLLY